MTRENKISSNALRKIVESELDQTNNRKNKIKLVGEYYPKSTNKEKKERLEYLEYRKHSLETELGTYLRFPIEASENEIAEYLDLKTMFLVSTLTQETWKKDFLEFYYGDYYDEYIAIRNPDECLMELEEIEDHDDLVDELVLFITESLNEKVLHSEKHTQGTLTFGLELEILNTESSSDIAEQIEFIDSLQDIGYPIIYDAIREIPLPKSDSIHSQLKTLLELIDMGVIKPEQHISIHMNIGGLERFDENIFILDQIIRTSNIFNESFKPGILESLPKRAQKELDESDPDSPTGFPFKVKSFGVIELRGLPHMKDFQSYAKALRTIEILCESMAAFQRQELGIDDKTGNDYDLSSVWQDLKDNTLKKLESWNTPEAVESYTQFEISDAYWRHVSFLRDNIATEEIDNETAKTNDARSLSIREDILKSRLKIKKLLNTT